MLFPLIFITLCELFVHYMLGDIHVSLFAYHSYLSQFCNWQIFSLNLMIMLLLAEFMSIFILRLNLDLTLLFGYNMHSLPILSMINERMVIHS